MPPRAAAPGGGYLGLAIRASNLVVMLLGVGMAVYGVYLIVKTKEFSVMSGLALALGVIDTLMGLLLMTCGHASLFYLRLYGMVVGLLELAQISVAVMFIMPQTQGEILDAINPPADLRGWIQTNLATTGYVLLGIVGFQALTLLLVFAQTCIVDRGFDEEAVADNEALLGVGGGYLSTFGYGRAAENDKKRAADRFGALADEEAPSASERYRSKAQQYYSKYGIR